jgi:exopolysaccharide biosynthesis polyprenyl glycosylphosphotransferase
MLFSPSPKRRRPQLRISERRLLLMAGDAGAVTASVLIALRTWAHIAGYRFSLEFVLPQSFWFLILVGLWILLASANDFYDLRIASSRVASAQRLVLTTLQMLVVYLVVFFLSPRDALPRLFILYYGIASFVLIGLWRFANPALIGWASAPRRALVVGTDWAAEAIIEVLQKQGERIYDLRGVIGEPDKVGQHICSIPVLGTGNDLLNVFLRDQIAELIVTSTRELGGEMFQGVMDAYERGAVVVPMPILYERMTGRVPVEHINDNWAVVLPIGGNSVLSPYPILKRLLDITLALSGLGIFMLLLPFLALAIHLDSPGGLFYTQIRVGLNGRPFRIIKFRTMIKDAEAKTGAVFSKGGDVRVTRVGRWLRKTRLDELPQVINVLRGEMSLVGPRPERPEHVVRLQQTIPFYRTRHIVRPGVTGWAQVQYHYGETDEDSMVKLQYDLYYIRHQSLALDLNIMIRTAGKMLRLSGV